MYKHTRVVHNDDTIEHKVSPSARGGLVQACFLLVTMALTTAKVWE